MKITFYTMSVAALSQLIEAEKTIKSLYPGILDLRLYNSAAIMDTAKKEQLRQDILDSDFLFLDTVGISSFLADELIGWTDKARGEVIPFGRNPLSMLKLGHIDTLH